MARQMFGTDGVRGRAGEFLTAELALALARTATARLPRTADQRPGVLVVRDTRESGEMLEAAIAAGVTAAGGDALLAGVLPTPAAPMLVRRHGLSMAVVISASHNPYEDNGIKLFGADGFKLDDDTEHAIEAELGARRRGGPEGHARSAGFTGCTARSRTTCASSTPASGARPHRPAHPARLRQWRHLRGRAGDLPPAGRRRGGARQPARRPQHQRRLRLHAPGEPP